jgi:hypothetical protein
VFRVRLCGSLLWFRRRKPLISPDSVAKSWTTSIDLDLALDLVKMIRCKYQK